MFYLLYLLPPVLGFIATLINPRGLFKCVFTILVSAPMLYITLVTMGITGLRGGPFIGAATYILLIVAALYYLLRFSRLGSLPAQEPGKS